MHINLEMLQRRLNACGISIENIDINTNNAIVLDDASILKHLSPNNIKKLLSLTPEHYEMVSGYVCLHPEINIDSLLDPKIKLNTVDGLIRIFSYNYDAEFGILKDRGKQVLSQAEFEYLIKNNDKLSPEKLTLINLALSEDLDYKKIINASINNTIDEVNAEFKNQRQIKASVINELASNSITKSIKKTQINPELIQYLCREYSSPTFNCNAAILSFNKNLTINDSKIVFRELNVHAEIANNDKQSPADVVLAKLVDQILADPLVWQKTWSKLSQGLPVNPITGTEYSGINFVNLAILQTKLDTNDNRWCSYKQAADKEYNVKKGERSPANVLFFIVKHEFSINGANIKITGKTTSDTLAELSKSLTSKYPSLATQINNAFSKSTYIPDLINNLNNGPFNGITTINHRVQVVERYTPIFNFSQINNVPEISIQRKPSDWEPCVKVDFILQAMSDATGLKVKNDSLKNCYYNGNTNSIHMASPQAFTSPANYYSALLHEVSHARMGEINAVDEFKLGFNPELYSTSIHDRAKEELRAELSAVFTCAKIGLDYNLENHSAYLQSWLKAFKSDPQELLLAANEANKISNSIIKRTHEYLKNNNIELADFNNPKYRDLSLCSISLPEKAIEPVELKNNANSHDSDLDEKSAKINRQNEAQDFSELSVTKHNDNYNKGAENVEEVNSLNNDESSIEEQEEPRQNRRVRR